MTGDPKSSEPLDDGPLYEERLRDEARVAFHEGRFEEAYGLAMSSALTQALRWFREEGVEFTKPQSAISPTELVVGLAMAAGAEIRERGGSASDKLSIASWLFEVVAELRLALDQPLELSSEAVGPKLAELTLRGMMLGQVDMLMNITRLGWLEKLAAHEVHRARARAGAQAVNARKASIREEALAVAIRIASVNPTLSHEELASKVKSDLRLQTTIRTLTGWVREWRRQEHLRAQRRV